MKPILVFSIVALSFLAMTWAALAPAANDAPGEPETAFADTEYGIAFRAPASLFPSGSRLQPGPAEEFKAVESAQDFLVLTAAVNPARTAGDPTMNLESEYQRMQAEYAKRNSPPVYKQLRKGRWFVLSGISGARVYYVRGIPAPKGVATLTAEYPVENKQRLDRIVAHIMSTFAVSESPLPPAVPSPARTACETDGQAERIFTALPEFQKMAESVHKAGKNVFVQFEGESAADAPGGCDFAGGESDELHRVTNLRARIDRKAGSVLMYEVVCDKYFPLEKWRAAKAAGEDLCD